LSSFFSGFSHSDRPYLHVYKQSNEIEEVTVIGLEGVNIESNPEMESLLGVSTAPFLRVFDIDVSPKEIVHIYTLYLLELTRTCGAQSQGVAGMDNQIRSHTFTVLIVMFSSLIGFLDAGH
jgi:hypothetical protein